MSNSTIAKILGMVIAIALVVGITVHFVHSSQPSAVAGSVNPSGGDIIQSVNTFVPGIVIGAKFETWYAVNMPLGTNQASWCNTTGQVAYAEDARFSLASTTPNGNVVASTTLALSVGTSTKSTITDTQVVYGGLINQALIATSTAAFDAKSQVFVEGNGINGAGGVASSTIAVSPSECVVASLENPYVTVGNINGYSATSTGRGYVLNGLIGISF